MTHVVVVGGGIGGMVAALRARGLGADVTLVEARPQLGGLASGITVDGVTFDGGPYILLDRVRLRWALAQVDIDLGRLPMVELDPAYRMVMDDGRTLVVSSDLEATVSSIDQVDAGAGATYRAFAGKASKALERMAPMLVRPHHPAEALKTGAWRSGTWVLLSLEQLLRRHGVTGLAADAIRIWTYIAGGDPRRAPGPLAMVPALIHRDGAARPVGGIHQVVTIVEEALADAGVTVEPNAPVARIDHDRKGVKGITLESGATIDADIVISDVGGAAALLDLIDVRPPLGLRLRLSGPLQSPGIAAYLAVEGRPSSEISFRVGGEPKQATACIIAGDSSDHEDRRPARIIAPLGHDEASRLGVAGQRQLLDSLLDAAWWRDDLSNVEVLATRLVSDWGNEFRLRDDAMNLVMARRQLLLGRLPHRIRHIPGLFLAGSWTHPGQWISFCAVSGVLASNQALGHLERAAS